VPKTRPAITRRRLTPADIRAELDAWEAKYEVPSERLADAFRDSVTGELVETADFHEWSQAYDVWRRLDTR
jgi:hypothetical protein